MVSATAPIATRAVTAAAEDQPAVSRLVANVPDVAKEAAETRATPSPALLPTALTGTPRVMTKLVYTSCRLGEGV